MNDSRPYILKSSQIAIAAGTSGELEITMGGKDFEQLYEFESVLTLNAAASSTDAGSPIPRDTDPKDVNNDNLPFPQQIGVTIKNEKETLTDGEVPASIAFAKDGAFILLRKSVRWAADTRLVFTIKNNSSYAIRAQVFMRGEQHSRGS